MHRMLTGNPTGNTTHEIPRKGCENKTEVLNKTCARCRLVSSGSGQEPSKCGWKHGSEISAAANTLSLWNHY